MPEENVFKPGDVVMLRSTNQIKMTVEGYDPKEKKVSVYYWNSSAYAIENKVLPAAVLMKSS